ncbi:hypothetical protein DPMN_099923 [Dreissena polymorpha]|uniref:Uncharacterized protein n=2 Tax=Dreissena polymorpha TaxID=45954 RepID=A0A9D4LET8_DREPO|nr:hypothetical protein DPMN_099923 [Dreissena polymorpha]
MQNFEVKKRLEMNAPIIFQRPQALLDASRSKFSFLKKKEQTDKIIIPASDLQSWFDVPTTKLISHIKGLLEQPNICNVKTILLVGGFAECKYIQKRIKTDIPGMRLVVPEEAGLAVLKGAVIFGHNPKLVASRVVAYTYGISVYQNFNSRVHAKKKKVLVNGEWKAGGVFRVFVKANDEIPVDHKVTHKTCPLYSTSGIPIYRSLTNEPKYTTDKGCELLGVLTFKNRDDIPLEDQEHEITFMFGETELRVKVKDATTGSEEQLLLNYFH